MNAVSRRYSRIATTSRRRRRATMRSCRSWRAGGRAFFSLKDQTFCDHDDALPGAGKPYTVFTPYKRNWLASLTPDALKPYASEENLSALAKPPNGVKQGIPSLET